MFPQVYRAVRAIFDYICKYAADQPEKGFWYSRDKNNPLCNGGLR